jgi:hypothetical protein
MRLCFDLLFSSSSKNKTIQAKSLNEVVYTLQIKEDRQKEFQFKNRLSNY